jgi:hypothetical protein
VRRRGGAYTSVRMTRLRRTCNFKCEVREALLGEGRGSKLVGMILDPAVITVVVLAFAFGFVTQRGSVCGVLAARQIVETGGTSRLKAFITASLWAAAVAVPLAWIAPDRFVLAPSYPAAGLALIGGALYGVGTIINGACVFGTASRALSGNMAFAAALPGIAGGTVLAGTLQLSQLQGMSSPSPMLRPSPIAWALLAVVLALAAVTLISIVRNHVRAGLGFARVLRAARWRTSLAMLMLGVIGGVLFAGGGAWSYPSLMRQIGNAVAGRPASFPLVTVLGPLALVAGGSVSVGLGGRFAMRRLEFVQIFRSGVGGTIMGIAASLVPGGNDVMLLAGLPSLGLHAALAYPTMLATQLGLLWSVRQWRGATQA